MARTVLIVEDELETRRNLQMFLEAYGFDVETASNGREALELLQSKPPCFVLLDLRMPVMDGWTFLEALEHNSGIPKVPPIAITTSVVDDVPRGHAVLPKPVDLAELLRQVRAACADA